MTFLVWRDEWTLDVGFMDDDHRALAGMLNRIAGEYGMWAAPDRANLGALFDDLSGEC